MWLSQKKAIEDSDEECAALPIIFKVPGLQSDLRLQVFETMFHVHSVILKLHSEFFFKFLDSPEKITPAVLIAQGFKYEWATKVYQDGEGWGLVDARSVEVSKLCDFPSTNALQGKVEWTRILQDPMLTRKKDEKLLATVNTSDEKMSEFKGNKKKET
jgi:hypothetical protein